jgi:hypothetical protein
MSNWAEIDDKGLVLRVLVGDDNEPDEGQAFMESLGGKWIKTSYTGKIRKRLASIGFTYDALRDAFIEPEPDNAIGFDENTCQWIVPNDSNKL